MFYSQHLDINVSNATSYCVLHLASCARAASGASRCHWENPQKTHVRSTSYYLYFETLRLPRASQIKETHHEIEFASFHANVFVVLSEFSHSLSSCSGDLLKLSRPWRRGYEASIFRTFTGICGRSVTTIFTVENRAEPGNGGTVLPDVQPGAKHLEQRLSESLCFFFRSPYSS
jgi:hypothetical protein